MNKDVKVEEVVQDGEEGEVAEEEKVDVIRPAFDTAIDDEKSEDEVKMAMITAGASFKSVTRLYNQYMVDAGFAISKEEKAEIVAKVLVGKEVDTEESFGKAVAAIVKKGTGVTDKSASALIRSWAKTQDPIVECYKKPAGTGAPRTGVRSRFFDALIATPSMSKEACKVHLEKDVDTSKNVMNHESVYQGIRELVNNIWEKKAA